MRRAVVNAASLLCALAVLALAGLAGGGVRAGGDVAFPHDSIVVVTGDGTRHPFDVELAVTPQQRAQGLMFRETLAEDAGMLFLFEREAMRTFWMKDTIVPLDIIFLDGEGRVVSIAADTEPYSTNPIASGVPAAGVLEVVAGTSARLGIDGATRIEHQAFGSTP